MLLVRFVCVSCSYPAVISVKAFVSFGISCDIIIIMLIVHHNPAVVLDFRQQCAVLPNAVSGHLGILCSIVMAPPQKSNNRLPDNIVLITS